MLFWSITNCLFCTGHRKYIKNRDTLYVGIGYVEVHPEFIFKFFRHFKICFSVIDASTPISQSGFPHDSGLFCMTMEIDSARPSK
jgi:hypothetical protein